MLLITIDNNSNFSLNSCSAVLWKPSWKLYSTFQMSNYHTILKNTVNFLHPYLHIYLHILIYVMNM